ncbi:hypothetical protein DTW90_30555 [Neorhizobium sp. P12A]|uniref:hypothetical protein n=1 Tax=Neorhizobium sp. P12A TaxID=2268027 RepID=UPI0011ECB9D5|nr:hypothetical protein [Neorhizobium sp. P12A]KAA0689836.1 hypothetical protein DTW90_30555 [Neorhizobium sp. P12A]
MFAISFHKTASGFEVWEVAQVNAKDIKPDETRVFVAREVDVDWVVEAIEERLNKPAAPVAA